MTLALNYIVLSMALTLIALINVASLSHSPLALCQMLDVMKLMPRPFRVGSIYLSIIIPLAIWFIVETDFGIYPDRSAHRDLVYLVMFCVLPILLALSIIHVTALCISKNNILKCISVSVICGIIGDIILIFLIEKSKDPESGMAYIAFIIFFCAFSIFGFVASSVVLYVYSLITNASNQSLKGRM